MQNVPESLPIAGYRVQILASVDAAQVTIIVAETGAGKSTQVPQYLAEHGYRKIIVTQPRILAARNLSTRVRDEWQARHDDDAVGYRTAHERDDGPRTIILYCTDGLQLVREVTGDGTGVRQVLVLDEIHEWNQNMEVLVAWAKKRCQEDPAFKVVVMSATIDADALAAYFGSGTPIVVPGRSYPVVRRRGEDLIAELNLQIESASQNVLVFLPGKSEIESVAARIGLLAEAKEVPVIPLHSQLKAEQQQLAFESFPHGKVILSTNIAQTSVTIDDVDLVLDSELERRSEIENGVEGLILDQISQADCLQRAGRAGRTKAGDYVLAPLDRMPCLPLSERPAYAVPEILRTHLDRLMLRLASAGIDIDTLEFFHAPSRKAIEVAKRTLMTLGAMTADGDVTPIGARMERYPVESRYSRMLVEAEGLSDPVRMKLAAIIAIQEVGGIVRGGSRSLDWMQFTGGRSSDLLAHLDVYLALPSVHPDLLDDLGIIAKNYDKAKETYVRICQELALNPLGLTVAEPAEETALMRCIVTGLIDQIWSVQVGGTVMHVGGGKERELSGGSVVAKAGLLAGSPFNLEVPTATGLKTLYLVQDLTAVNPEWLAAASPQTYRLADDKIYFDPNRGSLARRWQLFYNGKPVRDASQAVTEPTKHNRLLFSVLLSGWLYGRLEEERRQLQKRSDRRMPALSPQQVQERVRRILGQSMSLGELSESRLAALNDIMKIDSYGEGIQRHRGDKRSRRR